MKNKYILFLFVIFAISCKTQQYLPTSSTIDENIYGSFIKVKDNSGNKFKGELISVENDSIYILQRNIDTSIVIVNKNNIKKLRLRYAAGKNYFWTIPVYTLGTILPVPNPEGAGIMPGFFPDGGRIMPLHGYFSLVSLPINLIATTVISLNSYNAFSYKKNQITLEQLKTFARYPQGIPKQIKLDEIK